MAAVLTRPFIVPAQPTLRAVPPRGDEWLHELKFDGWRVQPHKSERGAAIYTKNGHDYTRRLPALVAAVASLPAKSAIIDGELTACDERGLPDFHALHSHNAVELCVWAFDLLGLNGEDIRELPLVDRKAKLTRLVYKAHDNWLRLSESFDDGAKLLASCDRMGREGIVSKRKDAPYRSRSKCDWIKVKCATWRETNRERWRWFERR
jgi:bifunctional non-homologous end joining protein LigD